MTAIETIPGPGGRTIAFRRSGQGRPVVLLHGITEDSGCFAPVQERLSDSYDVIAVDMAGHGASSAPEIVALAEIATDAARLIETLNIAAPLLVGHSYGATAAAALAAQGVGRAAMLVDQPMSLGDFRAQLLDLRAGLEGPDFVATYNGIMGALGIDAVPAAMRARLDALHDKADQAFVLAQWAGVMADDFAPVEALVEAMLGAIKQPVLSLHGSHEDADYRAWLKKALPHAELEYWPGAGHWLHLVEPDRFCERLRAFDN